MPPTPDDCAAQLHVCAFRVCTLDPDGAPSVGPETLYVSNALAKATLKPVYDDGEEVKEKNACGETLIDFLDDPSFVRADLDLDFLLPDPYLHAILISQGALLTAGNGGVGFAAPPVGKVETDGVSIEMFAKRIVAGALSTEHPYALWALPRVRSLRLGDKEFGGTAAQHSIITGQCNENPNWGDGPANEFDAPSDRCFQWIPVDTKPEAVCGPTEVVAS